MTPRPLSLALRVTLLFGIAALVVFPVFGWFINRAIDDHFIAEDSRELTLIADAAAQALSVASPEDSDATLTQRLDDLLVGHHSATLYVVDTQGRSLFGSADSVAAILLRDAVIADGDVSFNEVTDGQRSYRALLRRHPTLNASAAYTIAVAVPIDHHRQFLERFRHTLWLMTAGGIAIMSVLGWVAVRRGHAPLHKIVAQIRLISAARLDTRIVPDEVPTELSDLARSFNEMLGRMEEAFVRLSNYSADIAHELRTPVANLMTQTHVALSQTRTVDQYREILYSNIEEYERMAQMIGDMLFLAKADNGLHPLNLESIDMAQEVQELFDYYEAWAEERRVTLSLEGAITVSGEKPMLRRALSNLLSNAVRHTPPGQAVSVRLATLDDGARTITIENPGEIIAPDHLPHLFERFYRVDPARQRSADGAGLGLAIVKSIVDTHAGHITVTSSEGRTRFVITLNEQNA